MSSATPHPTSFVVLSRRMCRCFGPTGTGPSWSRPTVSRFACGRGPGGPGAGGRGSRRLDGGPREFHLGGSGRMDSQSLSCQMNLQEGEASRELVVGTRQRLFGIDIEL